MIYRPYNIPLFTKHYSFPLLFTIVQNDLTQQDFDILSQLLNNFNTILSQDLQIFDCLDWKKITEWYSKVLADELDGHNFNIFNLIYDELDISVQETGQSRLLKFLFDKNAYHGQGNTFLNLFLRKIGIQEPEKGYWQVTAEKGRVDVLLVRESPPSVIIIENKSNWAGDQKNQLYRYWYEQIYSRTKKSDCEFYVNNKDKFQILYLVPNELKKYEEQSITKSDCYQEENLPQKIPLKPEQITFDNFIQGWIDECIKALKPENYRIRTYLEQYKEFCSNL